MPLPTLAPTATPTSVPTATPTPAPTATPTLVPTPTPAYGCPQSTLPIAIVGGPSGPDGPDNDSVFQSLTVHPTDADILLLGTERNGFVKSVDGGVTWTRHRGGMRVFNDSYAEIWDIAYAPSDPSVVYAATLDSPGPAHGGYPSSDAGIYKSEDGGETWTQLICGLTTSRAMSIAVDPLNRDIAVAGLEGGAPSFGNSLGVDDYYPGGIFRTVDGGESWEKVSLGDDNEARNGYRKIATAALEPWTLIAVGLSHDQPADNVGYVRSFDGGATWEQFAPSQRTLAGSGFAVGDSGDVIVTGRDYRGWVSTNAGASWSDGPIIQVNGPTAISPLDSRVVVFANQSEIRRSTDRLRSATVRFTSPNKFREIVFAPSDPSIVYAETDGYLLYRSDDGGVSWRFVVNVRDDVLNVQP